MLQERAVEGWPRPTSSKQRYKHPYRGMATSNLSKHISFTTSIKRDGHVQPLQKHQLTTSIKRDGHVQPLQKHQLHNLYLGLPSWWTTWITRFSMEGWPRSNLHVIRQCVMDIEIWTMFMDIVILLYLYCGSDTS